MSNHYFTTEGAGFRPEPRAHSPWATDMLHGRLVGGLAARALEGDFAQEGWRAARLTVDLFRPASMGRIEVTTRAIRQGRKVVVADAIVASEGHDVARATAVFLPTSTEPPGTIWRPDPFSWPDPETVPPPPPDEQGPDDGGWLFRMVTGGFGTGEQSRVWTNDTVDLVEGERITPFVRTALSGDIACPLANSGDEGLFYINADYTMLIGRYPDGEWVGLEVAQQISADGIAIASATLVDRRGPFATSGGTSLARPPLEGSTEG